MTDGSVQNPRESTVDTEPPPPGGAYSAETVIRSVPHELLKELNYPLKPPKVPAIAQPTEIERDKNVTIDFAAHQPAPASNLAVPPPILPSASATAAPTPMAPSPVRAPVASPRRPGLLSGWASVCLIFVVAIAVIALWFSR